MKLREIFGIGVVIWIGGALVATAINSLLLKEIAVNIFGSLTCLLGLFLLGRWSWRKISGGGSSSPVQSDPTDPRTGLKIGEGMGIFSTFSIPEEARDTIERAIQNNNFKPKGKTEEGRELLHIQTPTQDWIAVVEVTDAIMITSAFKTSPETVEKDVAGYLSA